MRQHNAAFANFVCRFGEEKVLLDYGDEIVIPAFTRAANVRSYGDRTHFRFHNVDFVRLGEEGDVPVLALAGRFVKDTELTRHQVLDLNVGRLIRDEQSMRSSPSAYFVLILNNHRLIYFPETPYAPEFTSFEATAKQFLKREHGRYVERLYRAERETGERVTKKALYETHPSPTLEVVPLTGRDSIEQFLRQYDVLKRIDFRLVRPNDDIDAGEILGSVRALSDGVKSQRTSLSVANGEGLDKDAAAEAIVAATGTGNQEVKLNGVDQDGNKLSGNNERFQVNAPLDGVPETDRGLLSRLYQTYRRLVGRGTIRAPAMDRESEKIRALDQRRG